MSVKSLLLKINAIKSYAIGRNFLDDPRYMEYYNMGKVFLNDPHYIAVQKAIQNEISKRPGRTEVINFLLSLRENDTHYLEIGVRNPDDNFNHIRAKKKYSVDPGIEFESNPVDFNMTSDDFFNKLSANEVLSSDEKFDVIFIDGLHLADQVEKDITNSIKFIKDDGFIVLHDCNPPTEWHAREFYDYHNTPAQAAWNGTTWKAFLKWRFNPAFNSCCINTDYGIGIISKRHPIGKNIDAVNPFFEYQTLDQHRKKFLNLMDFESFKKLIG